MLSRRNIYIKNIIINTKRNMSKNTATIYVDGACSNNGQGSEAKAGIGVYWPDQQGNNISERISSGRQTNQRAEIIAASTGINQAREQGYDHVVVKTDSHYVKNGAESWIPKWESKNWSQPVVNKSEFQELRNSMKDIKVDFEYVPSKHNAADPLARNGSKKGY